MAYTYSLQHSFVNFDSDLDDVVLPVFGSAAIAFQFKLPAGMLNIGAGTISVEITDYAGTTIAVLGTSVVLDLCANAVITGLAAGDFPTADYQTPEDLFIALQLLGYTATDFQFFQCCSDLPDSASVAGVTLNFSRGIILVTIPDTSDTSFETLGIANDQCFRYSVRINGTTVLLSNPFIRVSESDFLTWVQYSGNENQYEFAYPTDGIENRLWLPLYCHKTSYPEDRKIYTKSNKTYKVLKASIEKEWEVRVNYFPDKMHDRVVVAMAHDNVHYQNSKITDFVFKKDDYKIDWDDFDQVIDVAQATFNILQSFAGRNSNCEQRVPCAIGGSEPPPLCVPVAIIGGSFSLPDARVGEAYSVSIHLTGDLPIGLSDITRPAWMTIAQDPLSDAIINLTGIPGTTDEGVDITVSFKVTNPCGSPTYSDTINVTAIEVGTTYTCGDSLGGADQWTENSYHHYGYFYFNTASVGTMHLNYDAEDRPNRFTLIDETTGATVQTTGWVGTAAYPGPWGGSLSAAGSGSISFSPVSGHIYKIGIEAGNADVVSPINDGYIISITCS